MLEKKLLNNEHCDFTKKRQWTKDLESEQKIGKLTVRNYGKDNKKILRTYVRLLAAA